MALDADALNYPYFRIRDVEWLKRTLLVFPHVARIAPAHGGVQEDNPDLWEFLRLEGRRGPLLRNVDLETSNVWNDQSELKTRIADALLADRARFLGRYGQEATLKNATLVQESVSLWNDRLANRTFQIHGQKVLDDLRRFLFENHLAWDPPHPHGMEYVEMHPRLGEAVLATLAFACARNEGLHLVTEFPQIYGRTIHRSKEEILESFLDLGPAVGKTNEYLQAPADLAEFVVYHRCDVSKLTPQSLLALNKEWEAIAAFRDSLEKLAAEIPPKIESREVLHKRLAGTADKMLARWKQDNKNWSPRLKELFTGDADEAAKTLEKVIEKVFEFGTPAAAGAVAFHSLGAAAGLAVALVVRTGKNILATKKKKREDPLRYLTMMEKAGVSYVASD